MKEPIYDLPYDREAAPDDKPCDDVSACGAYLCELAWRHTGRHRSLSTGGSWEADGPVTHDEKGAEA